MAAGDRFRLSGLILALCGAVVAGPGSGPAGAQAQPDGAEAMGPPNAASTVASAGLQMLLVLDQDRLFAESAFGRASLEREQAAVRALEAENKQIEAGLIAEEQSLTTRRASLAADEFAALADAFDTKVERIRNEQDTKARDLALLRDQERQAFLRAARSVLADLMGDKGAVAILEKSTVILSLAAIDVTDEAIARIDAVLTLGPVAPAAP